jgi:hypothetical protein
MLPDGRAPGRRPPERKFMNRHALAAGPHEAAVIEAITRLTAEFAREHPLWKVGRTVRGSRRDLSGVPGGALPELLERLARQRLLTGR